MYSLIAHYLLQNLIFPLLAQRLDGTIANLHEGMVLLELVRRQHAGIDGGVGGGGCSCCGGVTAAVHGGEAAPQAAAARVVRRPGAAHPAPSSVFWKQEIMVKIIVSSVGDPDPDPRFRMFLGLPDRIRIH